MLESICQLCPIISKFKSIVRQSNRKMVSSPSVGHFLSHCGSHFLSCCGGHYQSHLNDHFLSHCGSHFLSCCGGHYQSHRNGHFLSDIYHFLCYYASHFLSCCGGHYQFHSNGHFPPHSDSHFLSNIIVAFTVRT